MYANNDPINFTDPSGYYSLSDALYGATAVAGAVAGYCGLEVVFTAPILPASGAAVSCAAIAAAAGGATRLGGYAAEQLGY